MSLERAVSLHKPFFYKQHATPCLARAFCIFITLFCVTLSALPFAGVGRYMLSKSSRFVCQFDWFPEDLSSTVYILALGTSGALLIYLYDCFKHLCVRHCYKNQEANVSSFAVRRECEAPQAARCLPTGGAHGKVCGSRFLCFSRYLVTSDGKQRCFYTLIYTKKAFIFIYLFIYLFILRREKKSALPRARRHGMLAGYAEL